jgi:chromosome segregation ATPase
MSTLTDEQLATLTDEERAAVTDTEFSPEELAAMNGIIEEGDDSDDDSTDDDSADDDATASGAKPEVKQDAKPTEAASTDAAATSATSESTTEALADAQPTPAVATYQAPEVEGYAEKVAELATQETELDTQFKDGELDFDEYKSKIAALSAQREELSRQQTKAEISREMQAQTQDQLWRTTVSTSLARYAKEESGIDYSKDQDKAADLDGFVIALAKKPENAERSMQWFLDEAHRRVKALHGVAVATKPADKKDVVADAVAARKPALDKAAKTLAQVPGSDGPGDVEGEFANLDNLEGEALEDAIKKMSPDQRERFAKL